MASARGEMDRGPVVTRGNRRVHALMWVIFGALSVAAFAFAVMQKAGGGS